MKRESFRKPGYDCRKMCEHKKKGDHGIHCEEWHYAVSDGDVALSLTVFTNRFPSSVTNIPEVLERLPQGAQLTVHAGFPTDREQIKTGEAGAECDYVSGGRCFGFFSTYVGAETFFAKYGNPGGFEQPETFWRALEASLAEDAPDYRAKRADTKWERCQRCDATGTVPKGSHQ